MTVHIWATPQENWSRLPNEFIDILPTIESLAEMKIIIYILRHTWGYGDQSKRITIDEFTNGRKRKDGTRIDNGVGMARNSIRDGIKRALGHGYIIVESDDSDPARIKRYYSLAGGSESEGQKLTPIPSTGVKSCTPEGQILTPRGSEVDPRTEKETTETNLLKNTIGRGSDRVDPATTPQPTPQPLTARAKQLAAEESFDGPTSKQPRVKTARRSKPKQITHRHYDPRRVVDGYVPAGTGTTAVEIYFERFSPATYRLTAPNQDDITTAVTDLDLWRKVVTAWSQSNYKPTNIRGMLDWYQDPARFSGTPPQKGSYENTNRTGRSNDSARKESDADARQREFNELHTDLAGRWVRGDITQEQGEREEAELLRRFPGFEYRRL